MARRILLSSLPKPGRLACLPRSLDLSEVPLSGIRDGWDDLPGHSQTATHVVSCGVACDQSKDWRQRGEPAASARAGKLCHRLDLVAQVATSDGSPWSRSLARPRGS